MSSVTEQVKKYRNRLKIRDSERFADFGSLLESLFRVLTIASYHPRDGYPGLSGPAGLGGPAGAGTEHGLYRCGIH